MQKQRRWTMVMWTMVAAGLLATPLGAAQLDSGVCYDKHGVPYPSTQDSDRDGNPDCKDPDDDNDRLSDDLERKMGMYPLRADSDGDGIRDTYDLDPISPGSATEVRVKVNLLKALDKCGDGNPWDPYFSTLVLNVPGDAIDYGIAQWQKSNHPWDLENGFINPQPPEATAKVPSDARKWNLIQIPHPWTRTTAGMYDDDYYNSDDPVHLDGASTSLKDDPLSLAAGTIGLANSGTSNCRASIGFSTSRGFEVAAVEWTKLVIVNGRSLVDCKDVGFGSDCSGSTTTMQTSASSPVLDPDTTPDLGAVFGDVTPAPEADGVLRVLLFAADTVAQRLVVNQTVTGFDEGWSGVDHFEVEPGSGVVSFETRADEGILEWQLGAGATVAVLIEGIDGASATLHVFLDALPTGQLVVADQFLAVQGVA